MIDFLSKVITNILTGLYQPFWFAIILSFLFMFVYMQYSSIKSALKQWKEWFQTSVSFRKTFLLVFFTVMILFRTLLNRNMWLNPLNNVMGDWWIYKINKSTGEMVLTTDCLENIALFVPFTFLLLWTYKDKVIGKQVNFFKVLFYSFKIGFIFSFTSEMLQLFLHLGTWQLSDIFYNTLGSMAGGILYFFGYKLKHKKTHTNLP